MPPAWPDVPCGYLRFGDNPAYTDSVALARALGWPVGELDGGHFHLLVDSEGVAAALIELAERMGVPVR